MIEKTWLRTKTVSLIVFLLLLFFVLPGNTPGVFAASPHIPAETRGSEFSNRKDISKIMSVLESREPDKRVLEKAADKIPDMNKRNIRLMSSLCDRISADEGTPAADIAYSLLTALIVLS